MNKIKIWVYFNDKSKTLPISYSRNTKFYITSAISDVENIIKNYIEEMKKLISYLGEENVIISIIENGDSKDNTREHLRNFKLFLDNRQIINKIILEKIIDDPRKRKKKFFKYGILRIIFLAELRNRCFDLLYELPNIDFKNTIVLFFNDIIFSYEDIINLLSTNQEDYDAVCGIDFSKIFYDRWVSIDLEGNSFQRNFPYLTNKEGQDLLVNHKPIRVFSCWNGVIAFKANPLKGKKLFFRYRNPRKRKYNINNCLNVSYESECTYFHIDLFNLNYTKKIINPEVRVTYQSKFYKEKKFYYPSKTDIISYIYKYFKSFKERRNKYMSNYNIKNIKFNSMLKNWYNDEKLLNY